MSGTILTALEHHSEDRSYAYQAGEHQAVKRVRDALERGNEHFADFVYPDCLTMPPADWMSNASLIQDYFDGQMDCFGRVLAVANAA